MRSAPAVVLLVIAAVAAAVVYLVFANGAGGSSPAVIAYPTHTPAPPLPGPTPLPAAWSDALAVSRGAQAVQLSCLDRNGDGRLDGADDVRFAGLSIALAPGQGCIDPAHRSDYYAGPPSDAAAYGCSAGAPPPVLLVAIAGAGGNLLDPSSGESLGLIDIVRALQLRFGAAGIATDTVLATSALYGARQPQTSMEQWLTHEVERRLQALPCLRAVLLGHSHGGVTVTSIAAALEARFAARLYGVAIDRTTVLYDRNATELPARAPLLNVYQLNEGWHGAKIDQPNVTNLDASAERAPVAPSDGGGGPALVSHKTLDDAPAAQAAIEQAVAAWAGVGP